MVTAMVTCTLSVATRKSRGLSSWLLRKAIWWRDHKAWPGGADTLALWRSFQGMSFTEWIGVVSVKWLWTNQRPRLFNSVKRINMELFFNKKKISEVHEYKYLGNVIKSTQFTNEDVFQNNYQYLCDKARKAIFSSQRMTKSLNPLSPKLKFHIFDTLIRPVLTYGSDVWGHRKSGLKEIDRVFMRYVRCVLNVKATTSNVIVIGECGRYPPSVFCHISLLCFSNRMYHMSDTKLSKQVYSELLKLHENGFPNWISNVTELSKLSYLVLGTSLTNNANALWLNTTLKNGERHLMT